MNILLNRLYTDPKSPCCFSSKEALYQEAHKQNRKVTRKHVQNFLLSSHTYTLHKKSNRKFQRLKTIPLGLHTDWQADLAIMDRMVKHNKNYRYILVCVDVLSRQIFTAPVKQKTAKEMIQAFRHVFQQQRPLRLCTDRGVEFNSREMEAFFTKEDVHHFNIFSHPDVHAGCAERAVRSVKERLYKYFTEKGTQTWLDVLEPLTKALNASHSRAIDMAPRDVNKNNADALWDRLYGDLKTDTKSKKTLDVGTFVRIAKARGPFSKGYLPNYSDTIYKIVEVNTGKNVTVYRLCEHEGTVKLPLKGWFYHEELSPIYLDGKSIYRIEKVIKTKTEKGKKIFLVKWMGYDNSYNSWVEEKDFV